MPATILRFERRDPAVPTPTSPADNSKADFLLLATYHDVLIKEDGKWKFLRREIAGDIPVPRARR